MKLQRNAILRWFVVLTAGSYGIWQFIDAGLIIVTEREHSGHNVLVQPYFSIIVAASCLTISYAFLHRKYHNLLLIPGTIVSFIVLCVLILLPFHLGLYKYIGHQVEVNHNVAFIAVPVFLVFLFGPFFVAAILFRICHWLIRSIKIDKGDTESAGEKNRGTEKRDEGRKR